MTGGERFVRHVAAAFALWLAFWWSLINPDVLAAFVFLGVVWVGWCDSRVMGVWQAADVVWVPPPPGPDHESVP